VNALVILAWVAQQHCESTRNVPQIALEKLKSALAAVARRWKPNSKYKAELKNEVRLFAGLPQL
jgi:hypothetical protein